MLFGVGSNESFYMLVCRLAGEVGSGQSTLRQAIRLGQVYGSNVWKFLVSIGALIVSHSCVRSFLWTSRSSSSKDDRAYRTLARHNLAFKDCISRVELPVLVGKAMKKLNRGLRCCDMIWQKKLLSMMCTQSWGKAQQSTGPKWNRSLECRNQVVTSQR